MNVNDFEQFSVCWKQANEGIGKETTPKAIEWAFEILRDKSIDEIKSALIAHARNPKEGRFSPTPANVIGYIEGMGGSKACYLRSMEAAENVISGCDPFQIGSQSKIGDCYERIG